MPLTIGEGLGHYEVTALVGEGGMGEVYSATDTKLNRQVALKILPEAFASDPDRLARFQREAQVLASLNYPGIAAIHGIEESDGQQALVLELVEGPTLADRIAKGPIPLDEALPIAKQIAEALEAAHEAGVIHRDLKPANIKVRDDGTVKVLDFGLAKALVPTPDGDPSQSPTLTHSATQMGVIMGTAAYMSPEQARGKPVDKRADIWAFGCVLYEMLTGQRAFDGDDVSLTLAKVLEREPHWEFLPEATPSRVTNVLQRCLEKEPKQRIQAIGDVRLAMEGAFETSSATSGPVAEPTRTIRQQLAMLLAVLVVSSLVGGLAVWHGMGSEQPPPLLPTRFEVTAPLGAGGVDTYSGLALSADGRTVVFPGNLADGRLLYRRSLGETDPLPIVGTEGAWRPFFSPDGKWLGYFDGNINGTLKKVRLDGTSAPSALVSVPEGWASGVWTSADEIVFGSREGLWRIPAAGGDPDPISLSDASGFVRWLDLLPDGQAVLATRGMLPDTEIVMVDLTTGRVTPLLAGASPRYVSTGHLVFWRDYKLWAVRFDVENRAPIGSPVVVVESVGVNTVANGLASFAVGGNSLVHDTSGSEAEHLSLVWVNRDGDEEPIEAEANLYGNPRLSPDGSRVAVEIADEEHDIHILDLKESRWTRLTLDLARDTNPLWTPSGDRIVFGSDRDGSVNLFSKAADGSGLPQRILEAPADHTFLPYTWSNDGRHLIVSTSNGAANDSGIGMVSMNGEPRLEPLLAEPYEILDPSLSPDGRWIVYLSREPGFPGIVVRPFPDVENGKALISRAEFVADPIWSPDGREIFYRNNLTMMSVQVTTEPTFSHSAPEPLFGGLYMCCAGRPYDVSADGRFLMLRLTRSFATAVFVEHWTEELKRLVPSE